MRGTLPQRPDKGKQRVASGPQVAVWKPLPKKFSGVREGGYVPTNSGTMGSEGCHLLIESQITASKKKENLEIWRRLRIVEGTF